MEIYYYFSQQSQNSMKIYKNYFANSKCSNFVNTISYEDILEYSKEHDVNIKSVIPHDIGEIPALVITQPQKNDIIIYDPELISVHLNSIYNKLSATSKPPQPQQLQQQHITQQMMMPQQPHMPQQHPSRGGGPSASNIDIENTVRRYIAKSESDEAGEINKLINTLPKDGEGHIIPQNPVT